MLCRYTPNAEPTSTTSNTAASAIYNHPGRRFCTGVGGGTICPGACGGTEGPVGIVGIGVLAEAVRDGCDI